MSTYTVYYKGKERYSFNAESMEIALDNMLQNKQRFSNDYVLVEEKREFINGVEIKTPIRVIRGRAA